LSYVAVKHCGDQVLSTTITAQRSAVIAMRQSLEHTTPWAIITFKIMGRFHALAPNLLNDRFPIDSP